MAFASTVQALRKIWSELLSTAGAASQEFMAPCATLGKRSPGIVASDGFGALHGNESWRRPEPWCEIGPSKPSRP
jgi:hypothetical protein